MTNYINSIIMGDCIDVLKTIESNSIDLIFADPPYNMQTDGILLRTDGSVFKGVSDNWDKFSSFREYDEFCLQWLTECKRILKPSGSIWVIGSFQNIYRLGYIMQNLGFWILNDIIWSKPNAVPNFAGTRFQNSHETLLWCSKEKKSTICFNYKTMKYLNGGKQMKSVWDIGICIGNERLKDDKGEKVHSTQKPEKLLYNIILSSSKKGDVVLDPFFGTGTTGAIAKMLGRKYVGIEKSQHYIKYAQKRIDSIIPINSEIIDNVLDVKPPRVSVKELIDKEYLFVGQQLYDSKKDINVRVLSNGEVEYNNKSGSIHKISATILGKTNNNGWEYFWCNYQNRFIPINELRYISKEEGK